MKKSMIIDEKIKKDFRTLAVHPRETDEDVLKRLIIIVKKGLEDQK